MAGLQIKKAVRYKAKMRLALYGPSGSGKTYTALNIARAMAGDGRVLVIDTERGSASLYADAFPGFEFDVIELKSFHPTTYIEAIKMAAAAKEYSVLIIDSATHEWAGSKGALETAGQNFVNWAKVTPLHNQFIDAMLDSPLHIIATMRAKEKFEMVTTVDDKGKQKSEVQKLGMEVIQGKDIQYEFNIVGSLDMDNTLTIQKTRCSALKGGIYPLPGQQVADIILPWLDGLPAPVEAEPSPQQKEMRTLLQEFYKLSPHTYAKIPDWEEIAVRTALVLGKTGPLPTDYTDEQVEKMRAYVATKRQEFASKQQAS